MKMHEELKSLLETRNKIAPDEIKNIILMTMKEYSSMLTEQLALVPFAVRKRVKSGVRASELERIILEEINEAILKAGMSDR
jgi:hypothetical protein